jgi:hypothetical protein
MGGVVRDAIAIEDVPSEHRFISWIRSDLADSMSVLWGALRMPAALSSSTIRLASRSLTPLVAITCRWRESSGKRTDPSERFPSMTVRARPRATVLRDR